MKIGIDARLWSESGVGTYTKNLIKNLQSIDSKNTYILFSNKKNIDEINEEITSLNFKTVLCNISWHSLSEQINFPKLLNSYDLDLMHFTYYSIPIRYKKPYVITIHDLIIYHHPTGKASTLPLPLFKFKHAAYKKIIKKAATNAHSIITPTNYVKKDVEKTLHITSSKIHTIHEGVEKHDKEDKQPQGLEDIVSSNFFLYVGNAYPHKNVKNLLKAFIAFKKNHHDAKLVLVGREDHFYKKLKQNITKDLIILHNIDNKQLTTLYKHAIALVHPSLAEGFGLTPLEAMTAGCVVLASNIDPIKEVCQEKAVYFDPNDAKSITKKMEWIYNLDKTTKKQYREKGQKHSQKYSWEQMAKKTLELYESCNSIRSD